MKDLIAALTILLKYGNPDHPTHCEHDIMYVCGINPEDVSAEDIKKLDELGFFVNEDFEDSFKSFRYGSC